ncbi:MAG: 2OG-Fe(II) oxygenase [Stellaceae bacterium]
MRRQLRTKTAADPLASIDWHEVSASLDERGYAITPPLLDAEECHGLAALYPREDVFRSRVVMQRHGFGRGEYKYLRYPLPRVVERLRQAIYPQLAPVANRWRERLHEEGRFPLSLAAYLAQCHEAGQERPTPLILKYGAGDYNCLHQDLYGDLVFPLQLTVLLSVPGEDFSGGEFLLVEQRPRAQSKGEVVPLQQGEAVIFPVHHRPVEGTRGPYRVTMRHGVSRLRSGERYTLGIIFHDAA